MITKTQNGSLIIRKIQEKDLDELYVLFKNLSEEDKHLFHPHPFDVQTLKKNFNSKDEHYFVMILNNRIIGYSMLRFFGYKIPSFGICIHSSFRNKGFGEFFAQWTVNKAKEMGINKVILKTYKNNISARRLYEKIGFIITGETEDKKQDIMEIKL